MNSLHIFYAAIIHLLKAVFQFTVIFTVGLKLFSKLCDTSTPMRRLRRLQVGDDLTLSNQLLI